MVMLMTGTKNIKDVIAFPKTQSARDLMMSAPSPVASDQLEELRISFKKVNMLGHFLWGCPFLITISCKGLFTHK